MISRRTDEKGKLVSGLAHGNDAIGEIIKRRLKFFIGEWPLNRQRVGVNMEFIFSKNETTRIQEIKRVIEEIPNVRQVVDLSAKIDNKERKILIQCQVYTDFGSFKYVNN
jgi:hypothetical protein